jgi:hypothetical protein
MVLVSTSKFVTELMHLVCLEWSRQTDGFHRDLIDHIQTSKIYDNYGTRGKNSLNSRCAARIVAHMLFVTLFRKV